MQIPQIDALQILERITDGFFALDTDWNFTYINETASRLLYRSREELIGKHVWTEFPQAVQLLFYEQYHKSVSEQVPVSFEAYFPPLHAWFDVRAYPSPNGLSVFFQDVTKKKRELLKGEQHYKSLFENHPDAVYSFDLQGNYLSVNAAMQRLLGCSEEEFLQLSFMPLVDREDLEKTLQHYTKAANGITQHYETKALHKDGHVLYLDVTNIPIIVDGETIGVYGIARDITQQKKTEELLLRSEKLSAVGQLSASIAHEIRNPLTSLKGFLQLIQPSLKELTPTYFKIMLEEITRIESITSELLVLAKPQAHRLRVENVLDIVEQVKVLLHSQALMNNVEIRVDAKDIPPLYCVGDQIKQAFINLIKNAIESMPGGGVVHVVLREEKEQHISIQIIDEGCGIPEHVLEKIGFPFYTTKEKGTGLGMMTTMKIIESHGGTLHIASALNQGTTVSIRLPVRSPADKTAT